MPPNEPYGLWRTQQHFHDSTRLAGAAGKDTDSSSGIVRVVERHGAHATWSPILHLDHRSAYITLQPHNTTASIHTLYMYCTHNRYIHCCAHITLQAYNTTAGVHTVYLKSLNRSPPASIDTSSLDSWPVSGTQCLSRSPASISTIDLDPKGR